MQIIEGKSNYFKGNPHYTVYKISLNNLIFMRGCSHRDNFENGRWSILKLYHKDDSSNHIEITAEQYINQDIPEGYIGESYSAVYNTCHIDNPNVPSEGELESMFKDTFKTLIEKLERDVKLNKILHDDSKS